MHYQVSGTKPLTPIKVVLDLIENLSVHAGGVLTDASH